MNALVIEYIDALRIIVGAQLGKLKVSNPLLFALISSSLLILNIGFIFKSLSISETYDPYVIAFLSMINTYLSPRTSKEEGQIKNLKNDGNNNVLADNDSISPVTTEQPISDTESL